MEFSSGPTGSQNDDGTGRRDIDNAANAQLTGEGVLQQHTEHSPQHQEQSSLHLLYNDSSDVEHPVHELVAAHPDDTRQYIDHDLRPESLASESRDPASLGSEIASRHSPSAEVVRLEVVIKDLQYRMRRWEQFWKRTSTAHHHIMHIKNSNNDITEIAALRQRLYRDPAGTQADRPEQRVNEPLDLHVHHDSNLHSCSLWHSKGDQLLQSTSGYHSLQPHSSPHPRAEEIEPLPQPSAPARSAPIRSSQDLVPAGFGPTLPAWFGHPAPRPAEFEAGGFGTRLSHWPIPQEPQPASQGGRNGNTIPAGFGPSHHFSFLPHRENGCHQSNASLISSPRMHTQRGQQAYTGQSIHAAPHPNSARQLSQRRQSQLSTLPTTPALSQHTCPFADHPDDGDDDGDSQAEPEDKF